ncbi:MAG: alpha/beta hydrolase [Pseudomonadota bacterium]
MLGLNYASLETDNKAKPTPPISVDSVAEWELEADRLREVFADYMYGTWPTGLEVSFGPTRIADSNYFGGRGILEETPITLGSGAGARTFHLAVAYPKSAEGAGPMPMVISQNFSNNCPVFQSTSLTRPDGNRCTEDDVVFGGFVGWAVTSVFGEYIAKAPIEQYFDRGIAIANFYASEIVPDNEDAAEQVMAGLQREPGITSNSAIAYWSYGFSAAIDLFEEDARVDKSRIAVWGHSRHGKSALVAGAWDKRISMIVSHQSGFGGAALNRSRKGERIDRVVDSYPHWFTPKLGDYVENPGEMPFDQHQLVALNAPRPVFLGNGRRDVWSDPNSTYRAALEADKIWELYGSEGLDQAGLQDYNPAGDLAYQLRKGGHGVTPTDIDDFMRFYDAHWGTSAATP